MILMLWLVNVQQLVLHTTRTITCACVMAVENLTQLVMSVNAREDSNIMTPMTRNVIAIPSKMMQRLLHGGPRMPRVRMCSSTNASA